MEGRKAACADGAANAQAEAVAEPWNSRLSMPSLQKNLLEKKLLQPDFMYFVAGGYGK